ncbi:hypothetical protein FRC08_018542 [Ceratobasidium sp. 394]|nr:hypothetical protein FRC08_018542 [Ceratobasidium sp. 394]
MRIYLITGLALAAIAQRSHVPRFFIVEKMSRRHLLRDDDYKYVNRWGEVRGGGAVQLPVDNPYNKDAHGGYTASQRRHSPASRRPPERRRHSPERRHYSDRDGGEGEEDGQKLNIWTVW